MVLVVVSLLVPVAERFRLPHTVLLAIAGMGMGFLGSWMITSGVKLGALGDAFVGLDKLEVGADMFLPLFLPPLLFTAGLNIEVRRLMDEVHAVLLLAIVAVVVCIASVGFVVHWATGMDLVVCLLLGAVVSTTDPAAVIGIFRDVGAPKRLSILAEGESLLNDAVAIAAFGLFIGILVSRVDPSAAMPGSAGGVVVVFLREFVGGLLLGFLLARAAMFIIAAAGRIGGGHRLGDGGALLPLLRDRRSLSARLGRRLDRDGGADGRGLRPHASASAPMVVAQAAVGAARILGELPDLRAGLDAGGQRAAADHLALFPGRRRRGGGRLRGARAGRVRHAAGPGEGQPRPAGRQPIQGHPGMGRPARRRHDRAGHGGGRQRQAARGHPPVHRAVGHAVRAVHAVRQRNDARPVHACAGPRQAVAAGACPARPRAGAVEDQRRPPSGADHPSPQRPHRRPGRRPGLGRRGRGRGGAGRAGARPRRARQGRPGDAVLAREGALSGAVRAADPVASHGRRADGGRRPADRQCARQGRGRLRGVAGRHLAARSGLSPRFVAAPAARLRAHADGAPGRPLRDPDGDPERADRACRLQHQLGGRPSRQRRRGGARRGDRESPGSGRQRLQGAVAAVSRLRRIDRDAPARSRRHPLRIDRVQSPPAARASSAARSTTTCANSSPSAVAPSTSGRRSISAWNWPR